MTPWVSTSYAQGGSEKQPCVVTAEAARTRCLAPETAGHRERTVCIFLPFQQELRVRVRARLPSTEDRQHLQKSVANTRGRDADEAGGRVPRGCSWGRGPGMHTGSLQGRGLCPLRAGLHGHP